MPDIPDLPAESHGSSALGAVQRTVEISEDNYRKAFYLTPDAMNINRLEDGLYVSVNHGFTRITGFSEAEVLGKTSTDIDIWADPADRNRLVQALRQDGQISNFEAQFRSKHGTILDGLMSAAVIPLGGVLHIISITRDITERKQAQIRQRQSEEKYRWLADDMPMFIVTFAPDGTTTFVNGAIAKLVSMSTAQLTGMVFFDFLNAADRQTVRSRLAQLTPAQPVETHEHTFDMPGGEIAYHQWTNRAFFDDSGAVTHYQAVGQDITERKRSSAALERLLLEQKSILDSRILGIAKLKDRRFVWVNHSHAEMLGYTPEEMIGQSSRMVYPNDEAYAAFSASAMAQLQAGKIYRGEVQFLSKAGALCWFDVSGSALSPGSNEFIFSCVDITERKQAEARRKLAASVFGYAREGITITDAQGTIVDVNDAFSRITGYSREEVVGKNPRILSSGRQDLAFYKTMWADLTTLGHWSGEIWNRRKSGEVYAELLTISAVRDGQGQTQQYVGLFSDITGIKEHQNQLEHFAHFDALTNLPNRVLLADRLQQAMAQAQRRDSKLIVAYLDLDAFKSVNDRYGHEVGDKLLIGLTSAMKSVMREGDTLARMGGDEFVAVLTDLDSLEACVPLLNRLLAAASAPLQVGAIALQASASIGVTFYPQGEEIDPDQLLRQADQAMYQAKLAGKNRYHLFDADQDSSIRDHHDSLARIRLALARRELVLHYQPKVNMRSGAVIGAEALIRWQHPEQGLLGPSSFLPVIEDHPLAVEVGEWVIDTALAQMQCWQAAGLVLPVSVNIGARQLQQSDFFVRLQSILARHADVNPANLELEVLETSALADIAQVSQLIEDCAQIGVRFALDDFGTGYSSLTYLKRLRVALLKIDQSFVRDMLDDPDDLAILEGVIGLAAAFKREVIAEGVESVAHGTALLQLGCHLAQGYGIARPMPADQMPAWVRWWHPDAAWA